VEALFTGVGARPLNRLIQHDLLNPLAKLIIEGKVHRGDTVSVDSDNDKLLIEKREA
jgi:ATP-dependent Clp protease ATP-binding subunit ClpB